MTSSAPPPLRRLVLAAGLLHGVDVLATDRGAVLAGWASVLSWDLVAEAAGTAGAAEAAGTAEGADAWRDDADQAAGRGRAAGREAAAARLAAQLRALQSAAAWSARSIQDQLAAVRPMARPRDAVDHPGWAWVRRAVPGGALDLGPALLADAPAATGAAATRPLTPWVRTALGEGGAVLAPPASVWHTALCHLDRMGALAAERLGRGDRVLRPVGGCDVPTLLASATLRAALAGEDGTGMRGIVVPMRTRGWVDLAGVDAAFAVAAAAATDPAHRGFAGPVLVTADEVAYARLGARPAEVALRDPSRDDAARGEGRAAAIH